MRALELNDLALAIAADGVVESSADSVVKVESGAAAMAYWRRSPESVSSRHWQGIESQGASSRSDAEIARRELARRVGEPGSAEFLIAAPARFSTMGLGRALGVLRSLSMNVRGFADSAVLTAAGLASRGDPEATVLVIDIGLHHVGVARVERRGGEFVRGRALTRTRSGWLELLEGWLALVGEVMVRRTRFDPLQDAAMEQTLVDALPEWLQAAAATGSTKVRVVRGEVSHEIDLSRDQFAARVEPIYRALVDLLHELRPAGAQLLITVPAAVQHCPGLIELLGNFSGCELAITPAGFAASAASLLPDPQHDAGEVPLLRRLSGAQSAPIMAGLRDVAAKMPYLMLGAGVQAAAPPSHLLFSGHAVALNGRNLVIGRDRDTAITLPEGLAGVSRQHCSLRHEMGQIVLVDHSRYGTFVNGERVAGRVRLRAGDQVRIGDPGVQLSLIAVGGINGAPSH